MVPIVDFYASFINQKVNEIQNKAKKFKLSSESNTHFFIRRTDINKNFNAIFQNKSFIKL
ncbi:hypothetical protein HZS_3198 [Henneguya salminicola]|nr:hypothetical protein HZS_3198 [Henneguya salminicola]